jgi:tRNA_anti-like
MLKLILTLFYLMPLNNIPKYDIALSAAGLYSAYNSEYDKEHKLADEKYKGKELLVSGYFGGIAARSHRSTILELSKDTDHTGFDFVIAEVVEINKDIVELKWNKRVVFRCVGNGYMTTKVNVPLLKDCVLVK